MVPHSKKGRRSSGRTWWVVVAGPERLAAAAEGDGGRSVVATRHGVTGAGRRNFGVGTRAASATILYPGHGPRGLRVGRPGFDRLESWTATVGIGRRRDGG